MEQLKNASKYLSIAIANLIILTILLAVWTDKLERIFNDSVRPFEFLKILGCTALSLIGMRIFVSYFRRKNIQTENIKVKSAILLTIFISSYLYFDYTSKIVKNVIVNGEFRSEITNKIKPTNGLANGTTAEKLTFQEYQEIASLNWFPKLPIQATNITYSYQYDDFLPDYSFSLTYDLPKEINVDTMSFESIDFSKYQKMELIDNVKRVTYEEEKR